MVGKIKETLGQYVEGIPVLKELLQNSDDAGTFTVTINYYLLIMLYLTHAKNTGATQMVVCLDCREHPANKIKFEQYAFNFHLSWLNQF